MQKFPLLNNKFHHYLLWIKLIKFILTLKDYICVYMSIYYVYMFVYISLCVFVLCVCVVKMPSMIVYTITFKNNFGENKTQLEC